MTYTYHTVMPNFVDFTEKYNLPELKPVHILAYPLSWKVASEQGLGRLAKNVQIVEIQHFPKARWAQKDRFSRFPHTVARLCPSFTKNDQSEKKI